MAEDLHNEDSEEEKKQNAGSQDDDDFGLPDLEFEELEELDLDLDDESEAEADDIVADFSIDDSDVSVEEDSAAEETPVQDDASETPVSAIDEGIDEVEDVLDSAQLISDRLGDTEEESEEDFSSDINYDELLGESPSESQDIPVDTGSVEEDLSELDEIDINAEEDYSSDVDDSLADISSPDELAALGIADEEEVGVGGEDDDDSTSLFATDPGIDVSEESSDADVFGDDDFDGGSIFASDDVAAQEEEKDEFQSADEASLPPTYKPYTDEESKGGFAKVIIFGAIGFAIIGLVFWFMTGSGDETKATEGKTKKVAKVEKPAAKKSEEGTDTDDAKPSGTESTDTEGKGEESSKAASSQKAASSGAASKSSSTSNDAKPAPKKVAKKKATPAPKKAKPKASKPASSAPAGQIVEVQDRTGRFYVIVGSFIDQDLANDYANELSGSGTGVKILFPIGSSKRFRVSVADFDSGTDAANQIESYRSSYSADAWTLKY